MIKFEAKQCNLKKVPLSLLKLEKLRTLDLSRNCLDLDSFPAPIPLNSELTSLNLSYNSLEAIPEIVCNFLHLHELILTSNNLTTINCNIRKLVKLEKLYVEYNIIADLPTALFDCLRLSTLDIRNNALARVPILIGRLKFLAKLDLSHNQLNTLPDQLGDLPELKVFEINNNPMASFPTDIYHGDRDNLLSYLKFRLYNNQ